MNSEDRDEFRRAQLELRLDTFHKRRPPVFAAPGRLDPAIHAWLEGMVRGENRTLLIGGPTGTGKTWNLWKAVETLLHNEWRGRWEIVNAAEFADIIKPPVDEPRLTRIRTCEFLAIDDLGAWRVTPWAAEQLYGLIDYRWAHQLPTVVASNVKDLDEALGDRIGSRLSDRQTRILLDGADRRVS